MFFRRKTSSDRVYLQIVENERVDGRVRQRVIATVGRLDELAATGALDRLLASGARFSEHALLISALAADAEGPRLHCRRIGGPLVFGRLWEETGCRAVLDELLADRAFEVPVERAVFATVLHRLFVSGSDRACEKWIADQAIAGSDDLSLHHFYRAMAWLGEELDAEEQAGRTPFAPRTTKDVIEERLFERRRDLFTDLSLVFLDTTTLRFTGAGGGTIGARGHSKDHRPDLMQMVLGVVVDGDGRPVCTEMWPGNTADVSVLIPVIDRLRVRFSIGRVCVVADRGMISTETIAALEERGLEYVLGVRERTDRRVRDVVLKDGTPFTPLCILRAGGGETDLAAREVTVAGVRYIVCRNEAEAKKDRADRAAIVAALEAQLKRGDKALIGNSAYRRFLTTTGRRFAVDPARVEAEARYDGIYVLRTNARITPLQAMLRYRELLVVEDLFRTAKALLRTRPIYHSSDAAIRGHVFCSFLALILRKELHDRCHAAGFRPEWLDVLLDLNRLQEARLEQDGKAWTVRTEATGVVPQLFQAVGLALPPRVTAATHTRDRPSRKRRPRSRNRRTA